MSAPVVGDRVRVIAGQWTGWEGLVRALLPSWGDEGWMDVALLGAEPPYIRSLMAAEVEKVPSEPVSGPRSDVRATEAPDDANGPQDGGKR